MALTRKSSITSSKSSLKTSQDEDEAWTCAKCTKIFTEPDAQFMECQRYKEHFCITCLKKTKEDSMLSKNRCYVVFGKCRIMEQHAVTDIEIERRCKQIMENFEERITSQKRQLTTNVTRTELRSRRYKTDKTEDKSTKAKILVDYFSSVFTNEPDGEVPTSNQVPVTNEMPKQKIKEEVVLKHLSALKIDKSPGMDKLHPRLLKRDS
ncbi:unnamed protein product [Mytilus coruscus]|uniref:Uncharacterized protein n=1 Tax=Mytilus coruscus TaxID=42192 RepID=A0A6J8BJI0_MYTCO|nr:unnamed protein product [Mytilus coruscus]